MCKILQSLFLLLKEIFAVICSRKSSMCELRTGLRVVVFIELIKLRIHWLEIKGLILYFWKKTTYDLCLCHFYFLFNLSLVLNSDCWVFHFIFRGKTELQLNLGCQICQCCCHGPVEFSRPEWFQISLSYSYKSCIF